jgi:ketosteroid isomerase-like protein
VGYSLGMSQQNVEVVRRSIEAFNRRDIDAAGQDWAPEAEVDWSRSAGVEAGIYRGYEPVRAFWSNWLELFDSFELAPDEFIECGEHVVVPNVTHLRGRDGIEVEAHSTAVVTLRDRRIILWRLFPSRAEAFRAVGLEA